MISSSLSRPDPSRLPAELPQHGVDPPAMPSTAPIHFGKAFEGLQHAALRAKLADLWGLCARPLVVDSVLALAKRVDLAADRPVDPRVAVDSPASYLVFDLQRIFLYDESRATGGVGVESMVRFIVDGYPFQPFELLEQRLQDAPHPFFYPLAVLDILPRLWARQHPGSVTMMSLATAEIETAELKPHPHTGKSTEVRRPRADGQLRLELPQGSGLVDRWTDDSLRGRSAIDLASVVSPFTGMVRKVQKGWDNMSLPFASALLMWDRGRAQEHCFGRSFRAEKASSVAICEALERFQVAFKRPEDPLVFGSYAELCDHAVDPRSLFFGSGRDHQAGESLPFYTDTSPMHWAWTVDPLSGEPSLAPAQEIWFNTARLPGEPGFIVPTTNGCALGSSFEEAALFALFEAIERDGYLTAWYLRRPCRRIDPDSISMEAFQMLRQRWMLAFSDYRFELFDITTDLGVPTVAAIAVRHSGHGPKTFHGAAARLSTERACFAALQDLSGFWPSSFDEGRHAELRQHLESPQRIREPNHHFELYALEETFERLSFLGTHDGPSLAAREIDDQALIPPAERYNLRSVLERITDRAQRHEVSIHLKDLSHPWLKELGLHCVKVVAPGLYPIWFGHGMCRFGWTDRLGRLARDLAGRQLHRAEDCNLEIHPFA